MASMPRSTGFLVSPVHETGSPPGSIAGAICVFLNDIGSRGDGAEFPRMIAGFVVRQGYRFCPNSRGRDCPRRGRAQLFPYALGPHASHTHVLIG